MVEENAVETPPEAQQAPLELDAQVAELNAAAKAHLAKGEWEPAVECYEQVIALCEDAGQTATKAEALNNIASVHLALEDWEKALSYASDARRLYQEVADGVGEAVVLNNLAAAHDGLGEWQQGMALYEEALQLRQAAGDIEGQVKTLRNLAILNAQHDNRPKAKSYLNRALALARQMKSQALLAEIRKVMSQLPRMRLR